MRSLLFLLYFIHPDVCQKPIPAIDDAIVRLTNKTWIIEKSCKYDSCTENKSTDYLHFIIEGNLYNGQYYKSGIAQQSFRFEDDCAPLLTSRVLYNPCSASIAFIDSVPKINKTYSIRYGKKGYEQPAELTFLSDYTFVIACSYWGSTEYFRTVPTPPEIIHYLKRKDESFTITSSLSPGSPGVSGRGLPQVSTAYHNSGACNSGSGPAM